MLTIAEMLQIEKVKVAKRQPSQEDLRRIPLDRPARLFGRLSDPKQIQESLQSMAELAALVRLARQDGFHTELSPEGVERRLAALQRGDHDAVRYWVDGQLIVDLRDLGISGRLGPDKRPALAEFMADLNRGESPDVTGTIYLSSEGVGRLSRDQDRIVGAQLLKLMKEAIQDLNQFISLNSQEARAYNFRGLSYANLRQYDKAIEDYNKAIELNPNYDEAYANRGQAYTNKALYERAIQDYDKAISLNPELPGIFGLRAFAYLSLGKYQNALEDLNKAINFNPNDRIAYANRARVCTYLRMDEQAMLDMEKAVALGLDRSLLEQEIQRIKATR